MSTDIVPRRNPFAEVITGDVVKEILLKQVEKAREGNTAAASLVLKIAAAKGGKNKAPRRNRETPVQKTAITKGQLLAILSQESLTAEQITARTGCSGESVRQLLDADSRFVSNTRGVWSLKKSLS